MSSACVVRSPLAHCIDGTRSPSSVSFGAQPLHLILMLLHQRAARTLLARKMFRKILKNRSKELRCLTYAAFCVGRWCRNLRNIRRDCRNLKSRRVIAVQGHPYCPVLRANTAQSFEPAARPRDSNNWSAESFAKTLWPRVSCLWSAISRRRNEDINALRHLCLPPPARRHDTCTIVLLARHGRVFPALESAAYAQARNPPVRLYGDECRRKRKAAAIHLQCQIRSYLARRELDRRVARVAQRNGVRTCNEGRQNLLHPSAIAPWNAALRSHAVLYNSAFQGYYI